MRFFLIVLVLLALFATGWHAALQGTDRPHLRGAPQIQRSIHDEARRIAAAAVGEPVEVRTSGRYVTLGGLVESAGTRDRLIRQIVALPLVAGVIDETTVLDRAEPFTLAITKAPDGALTLKGFVPNRRAEDQVLAEARETGAQVAADLRLATGAPDGDWTGMIATGLRAVAGMDHGTASFTDDRAVLAGQVADAAAAIAVETIAARAPMGRWTLEIVAAPPADGYQFTASKPTQGAVAIGGHAPDPATRRRLVAALSERTGRPIEGDLSIAAGMPGPDWPDRVVAGIAALAGLESGALEVHDDEVRLTGIVDTDEALAALAPQLAEGWETSITVRNPTPPGRMKLRLTADGRLRISGLLPAGLAPEDVRRMLPEAEIGGLDPEARGKRVDWTGLLDGLSIVLPRFARIVVDVEARTLTAKGQLKPDFSADGVEAALRVALGQDWRLTVDAAERRPLAEITLSLADGKVLISGVLPVGVDPGETLAMVGGDASSLGLAGGGDGDAAAWRRSLRAVIELLPTFSELSGRVAARRIELTGRLEAGYGADAVRQRLAGKVAEHWTVLLSATETTASEGDRRRDLATDRSQTYRNGFWLPDVSFPVSVERCTAEADRILGGRSITFVADTAKISAAAQALLNDVAAVAIRCLNSSDMTMEVSAHTASVGNDAENKTLTERRASAIAGALARRGVRAGAIVAVGRGEEEPIATNDTPEGRARNQRVAFRWLDAE